MAPAIKPACRRWEGSLSEEGALVAATVLQGGDFNRFTGQHYDYDEGEVNKSNSILPSLLLSRALRLFPGQKAPPGEEWF